MARAATNVPYDVVRSRSWDYGWNPEEKSGTPDAYFHASDHASWDNPMVIKYHEEFLNGREKFTSTENRGHMAKVIPWLMSLSLIGAQNLGPLVKLDYQTQDLLPPPVPSNHYDAHKVIGQNIRYHNVVPCDHRSPVEANFNSLKPTEPDGTGQYQRTLAPIADPRQNYDAGQTLPPFRGNVGPNSLREVTNYDLVNVNVRNEDYKTTHKYTPTGNNGFNDEYAGPAMEQVFSWSTIDFEFDNAESRQRFGGPEHFTPENALPLGLEVWREKIFLTLPRWKPGIPATLVTVPRYSREKSPKLRPYPGWDWHHEGDCNGLTSVFRVQVDECDRLWVLDSGQTHIMTSPEQICPPQILIFDLKTDRLLRRYSLPEEQIKQDSLYSNIVVDVRDGQCDNAVAYLADVWRFGISVYDYSENESFRIQHHFFFPDPLSSRYELHGLNFQWTDGLFGLSLSPVDVNGDRTLFFHPMSSFREFSVPISVLKDEASAEEHSESFIPIGKPRAEHSGHSSGSAMDRNGVMFFNMVTRDSVWCWDSRKEYIPQNLGVVGQSNVSLIFPNDIKVDHEDDQSAWVLSNRLPMYLYGHLDSREVNFRLFKANVKDAIKNTVCDPNYIVPPSEQGYDETC